MIVREDQPMISVIIPVYGVERYLSICIDSILAQTYQNLEIILVDDGSTDNCPQICDSYAEKYPEKIKVYHKPNGGLSDARNYGVNRARAEYITFVDSDDYVKKDYIEYLYMLLLKYDADISCAKLIYISDRDSIDFNVVKDKFTDEVMITSEALKRICTRSDGFDVSACAKLYKRSAVLKNPYPIGRYYEDLATTCKLFIQEDKIAFGTKPVYCYYQRYDSILNSVMSQKKIDDGIWAANEQLRYIQEYCPEAAEAAHVRCAMKAVGFILPAMLSGNDSKRYFKQARVYLKQHYKMVLSDQRRPARFKFKCILTMLGYWPSKIVLYPLLQTWRNFTHNTII